MSKVRIIKERGPLKKGQKVTTCCGLDWIFGKGARRPEKRCEECFSDGICDAGPSANARVAIDEGKKGEDYAELLPQKRE